MSAVCCLWIALFHSAAQASNGENKLCTESHCSSLASTNSRRRQFSFQKRQRSLLMFGSMDDWIKRQEQEQQHCSSRQVDSHAVQLASSSQQTYNPYSKSTEDKKNPIEEGEEIPTESFPEPEIPKALASAASTATNAGEGHKSSRVKMWPPWPFNLLQRPSSSTSRTTKGVGTTRQQGPAVRVGSFMWSFFGQQARSSFKEMQDIGSRLWFHLPPMTPPLIILTLWPRQEQRVVISAETGLETIMTKTVIPLWSNPLARTLVLGGFSLAIMSWAHSELNRLRKLTPLPLNEAYRDIHRAVLPHVLPDEVPEPFLLEDEEDEPKEDTVEHTAGDKSQETPLDKNNQHSTFSKKLASSVPPRLQRHFKRLGDDENANTKPKRSWGSTWTGMRRMRDARKAEAQKIRRMAIYDELVALQAIKRKAQQERSQRNPKETSKQGGESGGAPLGYALVTGASRGIGRAIAVELARWEIPLILVARDLPRLTSLAYDLEACYGIRCCVIQADLSLPHAAEQIHDATQQAGLHVDIVVNNAGISATGLAVDMPLQDVTRMIQVNGLAVAQLSHLYGRDMKERRRGRILMVASVAGAVSAGPTVALYAATKAFEKMLGLSLAKELEPYGVGVTCLMPGAVRDTDFKASSDTKEALCWKLPFYTKSPSTVAKQGVRALLRGDVEVTPGWQNRAFLKVLKPAMPQRLHNILVEIAWNPLRLPPFLKVWKTPENRQNERQLQLEGRKTEHADHADETKRRHKISAQEWRPRSNTFLPPPLLLTVPGETDESFSSSPLKEHIPVLPLEPSLVGPEPTRLETSLVGPEPTLTNANPTIEQGANMDESVPTPLEEAPVEDAGVETHIDYEELRKLSWDASSADDDAPGPSPTDPHDSTGAPETGTGTFSKSTPQQTTQQQYSQQLETERHLLQLQQQTLKLQQQVQVQERKQFLEQVELDRRQREMEYEKRDMEEQREQREAKEEVKEQQEQQHQWFKRKAKRSHVKPTPEVAAAKPKVINPPPRLVDSGRDLMTESLDHPLFTP